MNLQDIQSEYNKSYDHGIFNHLVRLWFYLQRGLSVMNDFKYLVAGILAFYYTLKLDSIWWMIIFFTLSIPVLIASGYFHTHKMAKVLEWTGMMFSSYFARHNVDLQEKQVLYTSEQRQLLRDILVELQKLNGKKE